jgi:hypothetical protein
LEVEEAVDNKFGSLLTLCLDPVMPSDPFPKRFISIQTHLSSEEGDMTP